MILSFGCYLFVHFAHFLKKYCTQLKKCYLWRLFSIFFCIVVQCRVSLSLVEKKSNDRALLSQKTTTDVVCPSTLILLY